MSVGEFLGERISPQDITVNSRVLVVESRTLETIPRDGHCVIPDPIDLAARSVSGTVTVASDTSQEGGIVHILDHLDPLDAIHIFGTGSSAIRFGYQLLRTEVLYFGLPEEC